MATNFNAIIDQIIVNPNDLTKQIDLNSDLSTSNSSTTIAIIGNGNTTLRLPGTVNDSIVTKTNISNIGPGLNLYNTSSPGDQIQFKSITNNSGINLTNNSDNLNINTTFGGNEFYFTLGSGLVVNYTAGVCILNSIITSIPAGSIILSNNVLQGTIFIDGSYSVVQSTNSIFENNVIPLAYYNTGVSNVTGITDKRSFINPNVVGATGRSHQPLIASHF